MNLRKITLTELHNVAVKAAKNVNAAQAYLLEVIEVVDERKAYEEFELTSLFQYCTRLLNVSDAIAYELISVMRKSKEVPELKEAVVSGKLTLSKAHKVCSVITPETHSEWIELAERETSRVIEKCVREESPKAATKESLKYTSADRLELKLGVSEKWADLLSEVKDLVSQKYLKAATTEEAIELTMIEFIERHHPVKKAERAKKRAEAKKNHGAANASETTKQAEAAEKKQNSNNSKRSDRSNQSADASKTEVDHVAVTKNGKGAEFGETTNPELFPGRVAQPESNEPPQNKNQNKGQDKNPNNHTKRHPIKKITLHQVALRDQNQCTHVSKYGRCESKRWLDIHHVIPVSEGGSNDLANLTTLCSAHHRQTHNQSHDH